MPIMTRDLLKPVLNNVPMAATRISGIPGGMLVAFIAAINPLSYFTAPYIGLVSWMIMSWWFWNVNPLHLIQPSDTTKWNPNWCQIFKACFLGLLFNFIPLFFIYAVIIFIARFDAKLSNPS